ncbi:MAG TPA: AI-2E family transporter [Bacteroidales bacterium]|nr:AI-2E family transporter [Bacteroidales bacterium]
MWIKKDFFKYATGVILVLLVIFLLGQVSFVLIPIKRAVMTVSLPLIITLLFYYILRPFVRTLTKRGIPKTVSVILCFLFSIGILILSAVPLIRTIIAESSLLITEELPRLVAFAEKTIADLRESGNLDFILTDNILERVTEFFQKAVPILAGGIFSGISGIVGLVTALIIVPFVLFYLLKDDTALAKAVVKLFPKNHQAETSDILRDFDRTLSSYITGQAFVCLAIGVLMYIGYLIIGIEYALVLAVFSMITAVIPFLGPILGVIPAILVGLSYNPFIVIKVLVVMVITQQLEGGLITPQIMGKRMQIHPVTIIVVVLLSASLFGIVGILLAVPSYAVLKVFVKNTLQIYKLTKVLASTEN